MIAVRAAWVCPIDAPPVRNGWITIAGGRVTGYGGEEAAWPSHIGAVRDLGRVAILPGLVNAHTHLELSWLRDRVPPTASFIDWVAQLLAARGPVGGDTNPDRVQQAAQVAARESRETGTCLVGDVSNSLLSLDAIADARLEAVVFHELVGFNETGNAAVERSRTLRQGRALPRGVRVTVAPHAPYSVSAELFRAIHQDVTQSTVRLSSIHVGESPEELEMLKEGTGPWPAFLRSVGAWRQGWTPPGVGPVEYLDGLGVLDAHTLVVHGVQLDATALARLAERGCTLVTCPRSNRWVGVGPPPVARFYGSGVRVAVGTDSLASVADLNLFSELVEMRWLAPNVPACELLRSATLQGARALGRGDELGSIAPGKRAELLAVRLPDDVEDVEEYLVSGIEAEQVSWIVE